MSKPTIDYIHCSGDRCDYYQPDEGICEACMMAALKENQEQDGEQE